MEKEEKSKVDKDLELSIEKKFKSLTIRDDFMFCKVMQDASLCKEVLELVLNEEIGDIAQIIPQSTIQNSSETKGVRLDVLAKNTKNDNFNIEMQLMNKDCIPRRMRYYQASIDIADLAKNKEYRELPRTIIIFFCLFDPIGKELPVYTFENTCREDKNIILNDGTLKIIINVNSYEKCENKELRELLMYIKDGIVTNDLTRRIDDMVTKVINDNVALQEYRFVSATIMDAHGEGEKEGIREGISQGISQGIKEGIKEGILTTAVKMKKANFDISTIIDMTGLSKQEIEKL